MSNVKPSDTYIEEMKRILISKGNSAAQISRQHQLLNDGPSLPWTPELQLVITGALALTDEAAKSKLPYTWRRDLRYTANIGVQVLWMLKVSDVHESPRFALVLTDAKGYVNLGYTGWIPS